MEDLKVPLEIEYTREENVKSLKRDSIKRNKMEDSSDLESVPRTLNKLPALI